MSFSNNIYENCLKAIVIIFGTISATTMIIFCLSLTTDYLGQAIAAFIGLGIVLSQYVFSAKIQQDKRDNKYDAITIAVTVVIFSVSILGTWSIPTKRPVPKPAIVI
jgi:drug/metabolite transporter superfamily protein YnfA